MAEDVRMSAVSRNMKSELCLAKTPVFDRGSGIRIRGCVFLYSVTRVPDLLRPCRFWFSLKLLKNKSKGYPESDMLAAAFNLGSCILGASDHSPLNSE